MSDHFSIQKFKAEFFDLLDETFEHHHGIYTDEGTSLLETLNSITAIDASAPPPPGAFCIAAHVEHVIFYMETLERYILTGYTENVDWEDIWRRVRGATDEEWRELRARLEGTYRRVRIMIDSIEDWDPENALSGALAILIHTAYHLGAIRQLASAARAELSK